MILVDSLYINSGGGLILLKCLCSSLDARGIDYHLLCDARCGNQFLKKNNITILKASLKLRKQFYIDRKNDFSSVLCFGNLPAPVKMQVPVYTYFHNINLLTLNQTNGIKDYIFSWLKREYFRKYKNNTDFWIVQTSNTAKELVCHLNEFHDRVRMLPFFCLPAQLTSLKNEKGSDYVYIGDYYHGAKGHDELIEAWTTLHNRGIDKTLHLTVGDSNVAIIKKIEQAKQKGVQIINHGFIPFEEVIELYKKSKAIIYPSHNESLGLGIVEAISAGRDVIVSDLPFAHSICKPSVCFAPYSADSIAKAVEVYEKDNVPQSELLISNQLSELIDLIREKE